MPKAIFFDLGSTLWDDYPAEVCQWEFLTRRLKQDGIEVTLDEIIAQAHRVIETYCPSLTRSIVFNLVNGDLNQYRDVIDDLITYMSAQFDDPATFMKFNPLYPGVKQLLADLSHNYRLAVVSQHLSQVVRWMSYHGIENCFEEVMVSDRHKLYKPDPRLFMAACDAMGVDSTEVLMVGDRLDNDIWPANRLGMTTVWVLSEPYCRQRPRYHTDVPDFTVNSVTELPAVLARLPKDQ